MGVVYHSHNLMSQGNHLQSALNPAEAVAIHSMLSFQMPDPGLDRRSPLHPPPYAPGDTPAVAFIDMDLNLP